MLLNVNTNTHYILKHAFSVEICKVFFKWKEVLHINHEKILHHRTINVF